MLQNLFSHALKYSISSLLVTLAGFISFPILTRVFTVAEYGVISYVSSALMVLVVVGKLGMQHAIVRFYAEVEAGKREVTEAQYLSTVMYGLGWTGLAAMLLGLGIGLAIPDAWLSQPQTRNLLLLSLLLVPIRVLDSAVSNLLRAQQRSGLLSTYTAVRRYAVLGLVLLVIFTIQAGLTAFYLATLVAELVVTLGMVWYALRGMGLSHAALNRPLLTAMIAFGLPMIVYDISGVLLNLGDRFFIEAYLGSEALGVYSAAYNMCDYASIVLLTSLNQALTPIYLKIWETEGKAATQAFVDRSLHAYLLACAAIMAAISAMGGDALTLLASERYRSGTVIVPAVMGAMLLCGCVPLLAAGLYIGKQTKTLMGMIVFSAAVNMGLNWLLIPRLGLMGAAYATLGCYALQLVGAAVLAFRVLPVRIPALDVLRLSLCSVLAYAAMQAINEAGPLYMLMLEGGVGAVVFVLSVSLIDPRSRAVVQRLMARLTTRLRRP